MAINKRYSKEEQDFLVQKLFDGLKNKDIAEQFNAKFPERDIKWESVQVYRKKHQEELEEMEAESCKYVKTIGFAAKSRRVMAVEKVIARIVEEFENTPGYEKKHSQLVSDLQKALSMMQNHLNENVVDTTIEAGGTKIEVKVIDIPVLSNNDPIAGED